MQTFGGTWTLIKLDVLEKCLIFYIAALKEEIRPYANGANLGCNVRSRKPLNILMIC
jgi:hypothetical protein